MRYARIINGLVANVELWGEQPPAADGVTFVELASDSPVGIGYSYDGENFTAPEPEPAPVPQVITRRQLHLALNILEQRTRGELDTLVRGIIAQVPGTELDRDRILSSWLDSTTINRNNPDTQLLMQYVAGAWGMDQERVDAVFRLGATFE